MVGEPVETDRFNMGLAGGRIDKFSCGCRRTFTARFSGGRGEAEEQLYPCDEHKFLLAEAPLRMLPVDSQLYLELGEEG
jgi:hypothetical protein